MVLNSIPGLNVMGISQNKAEFEVRFEYETTKWIKEYLLIAGENGVRIELVSTKRK